MTRSGENGVALVITLMMVAVVSVLGTTLMFTSQSETWSSANYRMAGQARYAAESGVHHAANFLLNPALYAPPDAATLPDYNLNVSPITVAATGEEVVLSSDPGVPGDWPASANAAATAFAAFAKGAMAANSAQVTYSTSAKLLTMHRFQEPYSANFKTIQTWEITSAGIIPGPRSVRVEVSAIVGQYMIPLFRYAAFATNPGCAALNFGGGATTNSYDSCDPSFYPTAPAFSNTGANVGTNGNLTGVGATTIINGSLSTPRSGVGTCAAGAVTAASLNNATVTGGLIEMSQQQEYPTPVVPADPLWASQNMQKTTPCNFGAGAPPAANATCTPIAGTGPRLTPTGADPVLLGDVTVSGGATLTLQAGTYVVNTLQFSGNSSIKTFGDGPVTIYVAGKDPMNPCATCWVPNPVKFTGGSITNESLDPLDFTIVYAGPEAISLKGGSTAAALIYAPNAAATFVGNGDFYGSVISNRVLDTGGVDFHYDRNLQRYRSTASSPMLSSFTWKSF